MKLTMAEVLWNLSECIFHGSISPPSHRGSQLHTVYSAYAAQLGDQQLPVFVVNDYSKDRISFRHSGEHEAPAEYTTFSSQQVLQQQTQRITTAGGRPAKQASCCVATLPGVYKTSKAGREQNTQHSGRCKQQQQRRGKSVQWWECLHRQRPRQRRRWWRRRQP